MLERVLGESVVYIRNEEKTEEIWLSPTTKAPSRSEMSKGQSDNTDNATKKIEHTAITNRLRTVSWVITATQLVWLNRFTAPTFPLPATAV